MPVTYKCPNCGSAMEFDSTTQMLGCHSCGTQIDVRAYQQNYGQMQIQNEGVNDSQTGVKIYHCSSCGAELVADQYTSATFCSFCGNPTLVQDRLSGVFQPKTIIPFRINKEQAIEIYKGWLKKGALTPRSLARGSVIEKITGVYVPFWLYNYSSNTRMSAKAERVRTTRRGNTEYIYTDHFNVYRDVSAEFERIPADASEKMPDDSMDKLEPYDYNELKPFEMPYLSGFLSERYNYTSDQIEARAYQRAQRYLTDIAKSTMQGYSTITVLSNDINMKSRGNEYSLFPVWMLNFRYNNKFYQFMLNGQTGKIVADRPISKLRAWAYGIGVFAGTLVITMLGGLLFL